MTAQCEGMGEVGSARYEPALLPPCPSIRVLSYSNCQRSSHSSRGPGSVSVNRSRSLNHRIQRALIIITIDDTHLQRGKTNWGGEGWGRDGCVCVCFWFKYDRYTSQVRPEWGLNQGRPVHGQYILCLWDGHHEPSNQGPPLGFKPMISRSWIVHVTPLGRLS